MYEVRVRVRVTGFRVRAMKVAQNWATFGQNGSLFRFPGHFGTFPVHFGEFPGHSRNFWATQIGPLSDNSGSLCKLSGPLWEFLFNSNWATASILGHFENFWATPLGLL